MLESQPISKICVNGNVKSSVSGSILRSMEYCLPLTKYYDWIEMCVMNSSSMWKYKFIFRKRQFIISVLRVERTTCEIPFYQLCIKTIGTIRIAQCTWDSCQSVIKCMRVALWKQRMNHHRCACLYGLLASSISSSCCECV